MPKKPKISISEAKEIMALYYKLNKGKSMMKEPNPAGTLELWHSVMNEYIKKKIEAPTIHF
jgi:hypothetical protein